MGKRGVGMPATLLLNDVGRQPRDVLAGVGDELRILAQLASRDAEPTTHWPDCWRVHPACAVAEVERLRDADHRAADLASHAARLLGEKREADAEVARLRGIGDFRRVKLGHFRDRFEAAEAEVAGLREDAKRVPHRYDQVPDGCWVACIAGLTDIPHEELTALVPRLEDGSFDGSMGTEYHNAVNMLLRSRGWRLGRLGPDAPRGFAIGSGTSPRGFSHAVIVKDGKLWHDPHLSRAGVVELETFEVLIPLADSPVMRDPSEAQRWIDMVRPASRAVPEQGNG